MTASGQGDIAITGQLGAALITLRERPVQRPWVPAVAGIAVLAAAMSAVVAVVLGDPGRHEHLGALAQSPFGLAVLFVMSALASATLILPAPGITLTVAAAVVANPLLVGIMAGAGQAVGELTGYFVGYGGSRFMGQSRLAQRLTWWMQRFGGGTIFVLALIPNPLFDVAGMLAGALRMPLSRYLAAAAAGKIIRNVLIAYAVAGGASWLLATLGGS